MSSFTKLINNLFPPDCNHEWEVVTHSVLPSAYEQLEPHVRNIKHATPHYFTKKLVIILKCSECGVLNKTVESNP